MIRSIVNYLKKWDEKAKELSVPQSLSTVPCFVFHNSPGRIISRPAFLLLLLFSLVISLVFLSPSYSHGKLSGTGAVDAFADETNPPPPVGDGTSGSDQTAPPQTPEVSPAPSSDQNNQEQEIPTKPVGKAPKNKKKAPLVETLVNTTGILVPKGKLVIQTSAQYIYNSASQVALEGFTVVPAVLVGSINIQSVDQSYYVGMESFYYGLTNSFELEADVPYVYRTETTVTSLLNTGSNQQTQVNTSGNGLGDIEFGFHYQINQSGNNGFWIFNFISKSTTGTNPFQIPVDPQTGVLVSQPTGTGFWSFYPSMTVVFPLDPVVFYANAGYVYNLPRNFGGTVGDINPGNETNISFGAGFSLNEKASFSLGYDQISVWAPTENGAPIPLTRMLQMGMMMFGYSYTVGPSQYYLLNLATGVTPDAPNVQITLSVPLMFNFP